MFRGLAGHRSLAAVLEARHANAMLVASAPPGLQPPDLERGEKLVRTVTASGRKVMDEKTAIGALYKVGLSTKLPPLP